MWIYNLSFLSLAKFWMFMESFLPPINIRHLWRHRHIISYPRGTRMCLLNNYAQVLALLFSETKPWLFSSGLVLLPCKLLWVYVGRHLSLGKFSFNANEWIPTQNSLSDIVEYALIMLWREKEEQMSHDMTKPTKWVCTQRRLRSTWASAQSDQSLRCPHEECLGP